ncbi:MAG: DNA methyltransferase [Planctomycetota bacterium]
MSRSTGRPELPRVRPGQRPKLRVMTTTHWSYPSQHYDAADGTTQQGSKDYAGATPSWVIWQVLSRYTREGDLVADPMCGSGTTLDVCRDLARRGVGFDLAPSRDDIEPADARDLPLDDACVDFVFVDPPYSTHIDYSDDPRCIGKLDASEPEREHAEHYYDAMARVLEEVYRVLKNRRYLALYVSDSWRKRRGKKGGGGGVFMPIGFELFAMMRDVFEPVDIVCVERFNQKLGKGNWHKAAEEENFFLRGFNYLFIMKKVDD